MAMATEVISDFSPAEIGERVSRVQEGMKAKGWDAVLVVDEGTGGVRYLAGLSHIDSPTPSFIALGQSGDPIMVVAEGMGGSTINLLNQYTATMIESPSGRGGRPTRRHLLCPRQGRLQGRRTRRGWRPTPLRHGGKHPQEFLTTSLLSPQGG